MKPYNQVKETVFAHGTIPDGYFGKRASVGVALIGAKIVYVADCGYFTAGIPDVIDQNEAQWMLDNHPTARGFFRTDNMRQ